MQLVAGAHEDDGRFELFALIRPTLLIRDDLELKEGHYLLDDLDAGHLWHLELSDEQVNRFCALLLQSVRHYEVNRCSAAREELDLRLAAEVDQEELGRLQVHQLVVQNDNHLRVELRQPADVGLATVFGGSLLNAHRRLLGHVAAHDVVLGLQIVLGSRDWEGWGDDLGCLPD